MLVGNMEMRPNLLKRHNNRIRECILAFSRLFCDDDASAEYCFPFWTFCILQTSSFHSCEKPFWQIPLSTWEDIVHLSRCCFHNISRFSKILQHISEDISRYSKLFQDILGYSKISEDIYIQDIVHLSRMVLPGLKYFSETGWPWSSTAVNSGTARI